MTQNEAKKLKIGDRVQFQDTMSNPANGDLGTVIGRDYSRFLIKWDDGIECSYPFILAMTIERHAFETER